MSGRGILDADMRTLGRWLAQAWHWWIGELRDLVPDRRAGGRGDVLPRLVVEDGHLVAEGMPGGRRGVGPRPGLRVQVLVPGRCCLTRVVERPALGERDLKNMVQLEGNTLLPFPVGGTLIAGRALGPPAEPGRMLVEIAGLPIAVARETADAIAAARVVAVRVAMQEERRDLPPIDFAPAMREAALIARPRSATPLIWSLVGFLAALNLAMLIWRDTASVERIERLVEQQQPAVAIAQRFTRRGQQDRALVMRSLAQRRSHDALGGLAAVSGALPQGAWLQRYVWTGPTVRLTGYRPARSDVATALRRSGRFAQVRSMNDEVQATVPAGDPFDLTARILTR